MQLDLPALLKSKPDQLCYNAQLSIIDAFLLANPSKMCKDMPWHKQAANLYMQQTNPVRELIQEERKERGTIILWKFNSPLVHTLDTSEKIQAANDRAKAAETEADTTRSANAALVTASAEANARANESDARFNAYIARMDSCIKRLQDEIATSNRLKDEANVRADKAEASLADYRRRLKDAPDPHAVGLAQNGIFSGSNSENIAAASPRNAAAIAKP